MLTAASSASFSVSSSGSSLVEPKGGACGESKMLIPSALQVA